MNSFFIGMIFMFLNFNLTLNGHIIGLLPKFVGYYFVLKGIESFNGQTPSSEQVPAFEKIRSLCKIMIAIYIVVYIINLLAVSLGFVSTVIDLCLLAVNLYVSFQLTEGVLYLESSRNIMLEGRNLREKWKIFCIFICASTVLVYVPFINIIALIANAVFVILFLVQFNKTKNCGVYLGL